MATQAQMDANRANAQQSTGPTTDAGKTRASQNALKTGIYAESEVLFTENPEELAQLSAEYYAAHNPATPEARAVLDDVIQDEWHKRRLCRAEARYFNQLYAKLEATPAEHREGHVIDVGLLQLARIHRMRESLRRGSKLSLEQLHKLESATSPEPKPEPPAKTAKSSTAQPTEPQPTSPEIGFVSSGGFQFPSEAAWRQKFGLLPGHPLNHRECPHCGNFGRERFFCKYEVPKTPEPAANPTPTGPVE